MRINFKTTGGDKLRRYVDSAGEGGVRAVKVGFMSSARYEDGTHVASVAAWNHYGTESDPGVDRIPPRPFMNVLEATELRKQIAAAIDADPDSRKLIITRLAAGRIGLIVKDAIQTRIKDLKEPPNAPYTIEQKGSSNPLIDTGHMRQSVDYELEGV